MRKKKSRAKQQHDKGLLFFRPKKGGAIYRKGVTSVGTPARLKECHMAQCQKKRGESARERRHHESDGNEPVLL